MTILYFKEPNIAFDERLSLLEAGILFANGWVTEVYRNDGVNISNIYFLPPDFQESLKYRIESGGIHLDKIEKLDRLPT